MVLDFGLCMGSGTEKIPYLHFPVPKCTGNSKKRLAILRKLLSFRLIARDDNSEFSTYRAKETIARVNTRGQ